MNAPRQSSAPDRDPVRRGPDARPDRPAGEPTTDHTPTGQAPGGPLSPAVAQRLQGAAGNQAVAGLLDRQRSATRPARPGPSSGAAGARRAVGAAAAGRGTGSAPSVPRGAGPATTAGPVGGSGGPEPAGPAGPAGPVLAVARASVLAPASVQRQPVAEAPPVQRPGPDADPRFAALKAAVRGRQKALSAHPPARAEAAASQRAARPPQDDREARAKAANAERMNAARPGEFDRAAFVRAVNEAIAAQAPKNLAEADAFTDSGRADAVKEQVHGRAADGTRACAHAIETTTAAPPDTSRATDKPVVPLAPDRPPAAPAPPDPARAVPDRAPPAATDFTAGPARVDEQMAQAEVTEEQLARANEPEFTEALKDKKAGEQHAAAAPGRIRAAEARTLAGARAEAAQAGTAAMTALAGDRARAGREVGAGKEGAKGADEARRAQVTARLQKVFDATKADVEQILSGLDRKVDDLFTRGERAARDAFTADHRRRMDDYKEQRYSGLMGKARWVRDKFAGLPEEANQIFAAARRGYVDRMQQVISTVADTVGAELTRAKQRIATGRNELQAEVRRLPADLQAIGRQAAGEFAGRFDELTESVDAKGTQLVQTLATRYTEALRSIDDEIAAEREKNRGLIAKAVDAVGGAIKTIMQLRETLLGVLARAASAVMAILRDPIGFLGTLVSAVGAGLRQFLANIGEHLKKGLVGWLLGALTSAGVQLPGKFDLRGVIMMIGSLLGLTWAAIRGRVVSRGVPEQAMGAVEQSVPVARKLQSEGIGGVWEQIAAKVGDLKASLFAKVSEYLVPTVLVAGITWIISLLNPASAFVKAVKMIVDLVTFVVNQGAQIVQFVNAVLDAVIAIAGGGAGGIPALIEQALARSVPVLIGALAAILGIGGVADKVKKIVQALARPVTRAVDWVVHKIVTLGKRIWARLKGRRDRRPGPAQEQDVQARWRAGLAAIRTIASRSRRGGLDTRSLHETLIGVKQRHQFQELYAHRRGAGWAVYAKLNPDNRNNLIPISGKTLLVGEGNLSFTSAIIALGINLPGNLTATVYEGRAQKDPETQARADRLQAEGVTVEFGVDATRLHETEGPKYDSIVWMFPHPGGPRAAAAARGADLLMRFFRSAAQRLAPGGRIIVTLRVAKQPDFYVSRWRPIEAAQAAGLSLVSRSDFAQEDYPGYGHETTDKGANRADVARGFAFIFTKG